MNRIYAPLPQTHPVIGHPCGLCGEAFRAGDHTMAIPLREAQTAGVKIPYREGAKTVDAALVHVKCRFDRVVTL